MRQTPHILAKRTFVWVIAAGLAAALVYGCEENKPAGKPTTMASSTKGGAQLWADYCMRCHNLRPPTEFTNTEWSVVVHHMRVRANLTGEEQTKILEFIQSANRR